MTLEQPKCPVLGTVADGHVLLRESLGQGVEAQVTDTWVVVKGVEDLRRSVVVGSVL
jgi:hypothetical protein